MRLDSISAETAMRDAISAKGLIPPSCIIIDGKVHRFDGKRPNGRKKNCWYIAHAEPAPLIVGGDWASGITFKYVHAIFPIAYTERLLIDARIKESRERAHLEREKRHEKAAKDCAAIWEMAANE